MSKKITFLFGLCWGMAVVATAQQTPQFTNFVFNQFAHHPAVAGTRPCLDMRMGYRTQWVGFQDAPRTMFLNIHSQIGGKRNSRTRTKHGIGGHIETDNTGPMSRTRFYLAYAYHVPVTRKATLSMGLYAGFQQFRFNAGRVTLANYQDNAIQGSSVEFIWPDVSPGVFLYSDDYYMGFTVGQALRNRIKGVGLDSRLTYHYILTAGKRFKGRDRSEFSYIPSLALKFAPMATPAIDLNLMVDYQNTLQVGLSYRNTDAIAALFKVNFLKYFSLGYAFDFTTSRIRHASSNTHEIVLGISPCAAFGSKRRNVNDCPVWN